jgi:ribonuclease BN (tRNA processing enzyme)
MIDKLITSKIDTKETSKGVSLKKLKENKDGKIIDHLFEYISLIDRDESIFYIGDSKYYKTNNEVQENSIYKQFTYAKNVIQFNIDLLNEGKQINKNIRYRDVVTEGYNITPNFFIQGVVTDIFDFDDDKLSIDFEKGVKHSYHFKERIFDRDSLFVNHYSINFLFVLKSYTNKSSFELEKYRGEVQKKFRNNFTSYLKKQNLFKFYYTEFENKELLKQFIDTEFRNLTGRAYISKSNDKRLILAVNGSDIELQKYFKNNYDKEKHLREIYFSSPNFKKINFLEFEFTLSK